MTERETILEGLECCIEANGKNCPMACPFFKECFSVFKSTEPFYPIMRAALDLLKEEPDIVRCKECKYCESPNATRDWCKKGHLHRNAQTWFCADGERK